MRNKRWRVQMTAMSENRRMDETKSMPMEAGLYVLATPLGNLGDITLRALDALRRVRCIACEDTRVTRQLLHHLDIDAPTLISVREHNEREQAAHIVERIAGGEAVIYASDAGTPAVSDPGARLVDAVRAAGFRVSPLPGVSAVTAAVSVAGFEATAFTFLGFAPTGASALDDFLDDLAGRSEVSVFFESPHRAMKTLLRCAERLPADRRVVIARELTKKFETVIGLEAAALQPWLAANEAQMRGEFVIVVDAAPTQETLDTAFDTRALLKALLEELPTAKAAKVAAKLTGIARETLYELAETMKQR
jgi:16S rRNA (cytidine1402-2'-O)-methyltransferase